MIDENVPKVPPMRGVEIDEKARVSAIQCFGHPQNLIQPYALINFVESGGLRKCFGLEYGVKYLPSGEEAKFIPDQKLILFSEQMYSDLYEDMPRSRFTFAHELGHAILHGSVLQTALSGRTPCKTYKRSTLRAFEDPEWQANRFAGAFLMPSPQLRQLLREGKQVWQIAEYFRVSLSAAETRINKLK